MIDAVLNIAYRIAPEPFARRISETIWSRSMARRWKERVAAHIADGGKHVRVVQDGIVSEHLA